MIRSRIVRIALPFALAGFATAASAATIVNASHFGIVALQARTAANTPWQADLLNQRTLGVGKSVTVNPGGCQVDLLATFDDGHKALKQKVNVCGNAPIKISDAP